MFEQVYGPVAGSVMASALVAALPLVVLAVLLAVVRRPPWQAAVAAARLAALMASVVWGMPPGLTLGAVTQGMAFGLWPISWVVFSAVFFYNLTVASGDFDVIRRALARLTTDRRLLALLVAFGFGALVEGIAGFGAPVAITASMLAGLGFEAITAAVLALVANTAPVAFGSLGIPVTTLGGLLAPILGRDVESTTRALSAMVGRQLPFFSILIPAYLVVLLSGWRGMVEVLPAVLVAGGSFAIAQFVVSNTLGPELTDTIAALCSIGALALLLRVWRPRAASGSAADSAMPPPEVAHSEDTTLRVVRAFATYGVLVVVVLVGQVGNLGAMRRQPPPANVTALLRCGQVGNALCPEPWIGRPARDDPQGFRFPVWDFQWPGSYRRDADTPMPRVLRMPPVASSPTPYPLTFRRGRWSCWPCWLPTG
jgi:L-lactate permease